METLGEATDRYDATIITPTGSPVARRTPLWLPTRTVSWGFIGLFLVAHAAWAIAMNLGFRARLPGLDTLTANLSGLALLVLGLLFVVGRLRPADVGLRARAVGAGLAFTALYFGLLQLALLAFASLSGSEVVNIWAGVGALTAGYLLLAQLIGNALYEEIAFRGFLLPQLFVKFRRRGVTAAIVLAVLVSQSLFALAHVPNRLWVSGLSPADLPGALLPLFLLGIYFAVLYLLTGNLFAAVGVHALTNEPLLALVGADGRPLDLPPFLIAVALSLALAAAWRLWRNSRRPPAPDNQRL